MTNEEKELIKQKEKDFQEAQSRWEENPVKENWDALWFFVLDCCTNIMKSKCGGIVVNDLEGKALDATCKIMKNIKDGLHIDKLSSWCYLPSIGVFYDKKTARFERALSFDIFDNYSYLNDGESYLICREDY